MELYKTAVCNELKAMLAVWEETINNPDNTLETVNRLRLKMIHLCSILDRIETLGG